MLKWFRRKRRPAQSLDQSPGDAELERFFTDAEEARRTFEGLLAADPGATKIVVVHGAGAVGKSSLLRMYRLYCRRLGIPVGFAAGEETASPVELLERWARDLRDTGIEMGTFQERVARYHELQAQVESEASKAGQREADAADKLTLAVAQGTVKLAASAVPVAGPVLGAFGGEAVGALINLLRAKLSKADLEFFLEPTRRLTDDFLADISRSSDVKRLVLMLDTLEQVTLFSAWLRDVVQRLPPKALAVVAGRVIPDWERAWPGWLASSKLIELTEMSDANVEKLVRQYYALFGRGEPDDAKVREVVAFARGLPLAATTAVRLSITYQLPELLPTGPRAAADIADQLLQGVPSETRPSLEAAAVLRWFNADSLAALLDTPDAGSLYEELRRWPFTRERAQGLGVHDTLREVIGDALIARSPRRFRDLNERAVAYYKSVLETARGDEHERLRLEWLYHSVRADEDSGIQAFRELAEQLVRSQWTSRVRSLVNDVATYSLHEESNRLWRRYYTSRLEQLQGRAALAETEYRSITANDAAEPLLRAYAFCDLGTLLAALDRLAEPDGEQRALEAVAHSQAACPEPDAKLISNEITVMNIANVRADWSEASHHIEAARTFAATRNDTYGLVTADLLQSAAAGMQGSWRGYLDSRRRCQDGLAALGDVPALSMQVSYFTWPLVFMGRYQEARQSSEEALRLGRRLEETELMVTILESVGLALGMQEAYDDAAARFGEAYNYYCNVHEREGAGTGAPERYIRAMLSFRGLIALREGRLDDAESDLDWALRVKTEIGDRIGTPELHVWRGQLHEFRGEWDQAAASYSSALDLRAMGRNYFDSWAFAGRARVHLARGRSDDCITDLTAATDIATRYEYNDVLAAVHLTYGTIAWASNVAPDDIAVHYRSALTHGLRFNRFLLDEVLAGRYRGTVLHPIMPACLERGADGRRVLESLREWWIAGVNEPGEHGAASVSLIAAGVPLMQAERQARTREPGTRAPQTAVVDRIEGALAGTATGG